jgi:peptidoglycan hydrolase CwlO-like protein
MARKKARQAASPRLDRIVEPIIIPGTDDFLKAGEPVASGPPGTLLMLAGSGFGTSAGRVLASFGDHTVEVFPPPLFSDTQALVTVPLLDPGRVAVRVVVAGVASNARNFEIARVPGRRQQPGDSVRRLVSLLDPFMVLVGAEIRIADFGRFATRQFQEHLARDVTEARMGLLATRHRLDTLADVGPEFAGFLELRDERDMEFIRRVNLRVANRSLLLFDEFVNHSQAIPRVEAAMARIRQGGTTTATKTLEIAAETGSFLANLATSAESAAQSFYSSVSAGIVVAEADSSFNPVIAIAAGLAAILQTLTFAARVGALLSRNADADRQDQEELTFRRKVEAKLDKIEEKADRSEQKADKSERKLDKVESKLDRTESKSDRIEGKLDKAEVKLDRVEEKLDRSEIKEDILESKLDRMEPKLDHVEAKLDRQEKKADRAESKLDRLEGKADRAEGKLDRLEGKADKAESKLDRIEPKLDKIEPKLDKLEPKVDKLEPKLDRLEAKADRAEMKLDKIEPKLDKIEPKLDKLEPKIDKLELKLDVLQIKADRSKEFWQIGPEVWSVSGATRAGVRVDRRGGAIPSNWSFNVESIHVPEDGVQVVAIAVDGVRTDLAARGIVAPVNVLVTGGIVLVGASDSVIVEFDRPYTGRLEFNGEKPQAMRLCTLAGGAGATQVSPNPCQP